MTQRYEPKSAFLRAIIAEELPLSGCQAADANLEQLIATTRDQDCSNRDWATFLLSHENIDTAAVRDALLVAASDEDDNVRAEAINGLARRDRDLALPLVQKALAQEQASVPIFEAAALLAHQSLVDDLRRWIEPSGKEYADHAASEALDACLSGVPPNAIR